MKIIHLVLGKANPDRMNGVNKVVHELATQQILHGDEAAVWGITADLSENYGERAFDTRLFRSARNPFGLPQGFEEALDALPPMVVFHLHGGWIPVFATVGRVLSQRGIPFVLTAHGAYNRIAMQKSRLRKTLYFQVFEKQLLRRAARVHCIGQSEMKGLAAICPEARTQLLPYGFQVTTKPQPRPANGRCVFSFVGRIDIHTKGLDLMVAAFRQLAMYSDQWEWRITGDGGERAALEQMVQQAGIGAQVVFTGSKFGAEKEAVLASADVFLHASRNEGLPASVLEAASLGLPCIVTEATNVAGDVIAFGAGMALPDNDADALADVLRTLLDAWQRNELAAMQRNSRRMVLERFGWHGLLESYRAMYAGASCGRCEPGGSAAWRFYTPRRVGRPTAGMRPKQNPSTI